LRIDVGGEAFATKKALEERCRLVLYRSPLGDPLSADDFAFMRALLEHHDDADAKIGCGVASMQVRRDPYGGQCFWLRRIDGTQTDFSFRSCIRPKAPEADFRAACRRAITEQILDFKKFAFSNGHDVCAVTGVRVTADDCHVDHAPPATFLALLSKFVELRGLVVAAVKIAGHEDGSTEKRIVDHSLREDWQMFHRDHAVLRITTAHANLSDVKREARLMGVR